MTPWRQGFSLVEMAVVLTIVGILLGFGITMGNDAMTAANRVNTQQRLGTIQAALESFSTMNGYLPCPASYTQTPRGNPTTFGTELRLGNICNGAGIIALMNGYIGTVPVRALGLPDAYAADSWGNKFTYAVSGPHVHNTGSYATTPGTITVYYGDRGGVNYPITSVNSRAVPSLSSNIAPGAGATYVVVSHGPDGRGSYPLRGTVQTICDTAGQNDVENCNGDLNFWDTAYSDNLRNSSIFFDDFIVWGTNAQKRVPVSTSVPSCTVNCENWCAPCAGTIPNLPGPPSIFVPGTAFLCEKVIASTSPCNATCIWSGTYLSDGTVVRCP